MMARRPIRHPAARRSVSRGVIAWLLAITLTFSFFHASACEAEIRQEPPVTAMTAEQSRPAPQPAASHAMADHCLLHLLGDIIHPASIATVQDVKAELSWHDDPAQPVSAPDSPFKPPRA